MAEMRKTGKAVLRAVGGRRASGVCQYAMDAKGAEVSVSAQTFDGAAALEAILQFGPDKGYRCRFPAGLGETVRCGEAGVMAVWVTADGKPALFAQISPGAFDMAEAQIRMADTPRKLEEPGAAKPPDAAPAPVSVKAAAVPAARLPFRDAAAGGPAAPFRPPEPVLLLQPGSQPAQEGARPAKPAGEAASFQPLVVRRAPRPTPRPPVYTPLWDDVSAEFEKMLDDLPPVQPFNGNAEGARFAEMPLAGAVQCYIGSVEIKGMKVFLQAVPARPFARPAGFDHSLVSRDGQTFWVKYFIQN